MKLKNIDHIVITTKDLEKCLDFYKRFLNMEISDIGGRYSLHFGNQKFNIHQRPGEFLPAAENPAYGSLDICLVAEGSIEEIYEELKSLNAPLEGEIFDRNGAGGKMKSVYLRDPDGNLIEICVYNN